MRYFHRTSLPPDDALAEADRYFGGRLEQIESGDRSRSYSGTVGRVDLTVRAEAGHYTLITLTTDQVGESEADKHAKRFLTEVHTRVDSGHVARGAF
jgi:hypothetical protein